MGRHNSSLFFQGKLTSEKFSMAIEKMFCNPSATLFLRVEARLV